MKKTIQTILIIIFFQNIITAQINYYSIEQVKDTVVKYKNPFEAFDKLDLYKIPINEFRKDSFLISKAIDLFNKDLRKSFIYKILKNEKFSWLKNESDQKSFVMRYLKENKKIPHKKLYFFYDSIAKIPDLKKLYLDSAFREITKKDSIRIYAYKLSMTPNKYITFHSKLMTQTSYDTIRSYFDRYYKNFNEDKHFGGGEYDAVIIALINMGDPEIRAKYDAWFDKKLKKQEIRLNEYLFLTKYVNGSLKYRELAKLLFYNYFIETISDGGREQIKGLVVFHHFPTIDTLDYEARKKISDNMKGDFMDYYKEDKNGNIIFEYKSTYEEFYKYYMDYVAYLEKKEKALFENIKYKTNN